jgi:hypothetical protein
MIYCEWTKLTLFEEGGQAGDAEPFTGWRSTPLAAAVFDGAAFGTDGVCDRWNE